MAANIARIHAMQEVERGQFDSAGIVAALVVKERSADRAFWSRFEVAVQRGHDTDVGRMVREALVEYIEDGGQHGNVDT